MAGSATYGRLRQLMTYLLWFQKIESISVDFLDFLEPKIDFMHFCDTKWREKQTGDWNSPKSNGFVGQRETIQGSLIQESLKTCEKNLGLLLRGRVKCYPFLLEKGGGVNSGRRPSSSTRLWKCRRKSRWGKSFESSYWKDGRMRHRGWR